MLKYLFYISVGYVVFIVAKNGVQLALDSLNKKKELSNSELVKCAYCDGFVSQNIAIKLHDLIFCSEECIQKFKNKQD